MYGSIPKFDLKTPEKCNEDLNPIITEKNTFQNPKISSKIGRRYSCTNYYPEVDTIINKYNKKCNENSTQQSSSNDLRIDSNGHKLYRNYQYGKSQNSQKLQISKPMKNITNTEIIYRPSYLVSELIEGD